MKRMAWDLVVLAFLCGWMGKWAHGCGHQTALDVVVIVLVAGGALALRIWRST